MSRAVLCALLLLLLVPNSARAELAGGKIVRVPGAWSEELIEDIELGLQALPAGARQFPGGNLEIEIHTRAAPFGLGGSAPDQPDLTDDLRRLHLYRFVEPDEPGALARLRQLPPDLRERLWRRRAVVHAVMRRWDQQLHWSERSAWRDIAGWNDAGERAQNVYAWAYSRNRGRESAALDLATFAEEALLPAESLAESGLPADESVRCQEFSKSRSLAAMLADLPSPGVAAPEVARLLPGDCPAFDAWADLDSLSHVEVLFAAPSAVRAQSIFGHVLLRAVRRQSSLVSGPSQEQVMEIAALTGPGDAAAQYAKKGLTGGYLSIFSHTNFASIAQTNLEVEQRNLRRFRLNLRRDEERHVLERMWELERRGYTRYYFLDENCAAMLVFLLRGALDEDRHIDSPGWLWVMPTSALDAIGRVMIETRRRNGELEREPLLVAVPGELRSLQQIADDADELRSASVEELGALTTPELALRWRSAHASLQGSNPLLRRSVYERLPQLIGATFEQSPSPRGRRLVWDYLLATLRVERYAAAVASNARDGIDRRSIVVPVGLVLPSADDLVRQRQREFQHEDATARKEHELERVLALHDLMRSLPRRPLESKERVRLAEAEATSVTFRRFSELHVELMDRFFPSVDLQENLRDEAEDRQEQASARSERSVPRSGIGKFGIAVGAGALPSQGASPVLQLHTAVLAEQLGDQRQRGFGPRTEVRLVEGQLQLGLRANAWPELLQTEMTLARFRTLGREPSSLRRGLFDQLGWEVGLTSSRRRHALVSTRSSLDAGFLAVLGAAPDLERFTLLGVGAAVDLDAANLWPNGLALGPRLSLLHRSPLGGVLANAWRFEASYVPRIDLLGGRAGGFGQRASVQTGFDFVTGTAQHSVLMGPRIVAAWERTVGRDDPRVYGVLAIETP